MGDTQQIFSGRLNNVLQNSEKEDKIDDCVVDYNLNLENYHQYSNTYRTFLYYHRERVKF